MLINLLITVSNAYSFEQKEPSPEVLHRLVYRYGVFHLWTLILAII
jgi:hypothetical protein